jgi:hypothetical protein
LDWFYDLLATAVEGPAKAWSNPKGSEGIAARFSSQLIISFSKFVKRRVGEEKHAAKKC